MKVISDISSFASILGFLIPYFQSNMEHEYTTTIFQYGCLGIFAASNIYVFYRYLNNRKKIYRNKKEIHDYMLNWISNTGRTIIFTRDMSWAVTNNMQLKLTEKSTMGELILCMPKKTKLAEILEKKGAEVYIYPNLDYMPISRFTIIRYGRSDSKVAIGRAIDNGKHSIEEFEKGLHSQYHLAEDLFMVLKKMG